MTIFLKTFGQKFKPARNFFATTSSLMNSPLPKNHFDIAHEQFHEGRKCKKINPTASDKEEA